MARTGQHTGQLVVAAPPAANVEIRYWQPETKHMREAKCLGVDRERDRDEESVREVEGGRGRAGKLERVVFECRLITKPRNT